MNKTFNPPAPGSYRLPSWIKALLIVLFVGAAAWIALCIIAVKWTGNEATIYDAAAGPAQKISELD